jgi:hypothetical protein
MPQMLDNKALKQNVVIPSPEYDTKNIQCDLQVQDCKFGEQLEEQVVLATHKQVLVTASPDDTTSRMNAILQELTDNKRMMTSLLGQLHTLSKRIRACECGGQVDGTGMRSRDECSQSMDQYPSYIA